MDPTEAMDCLQRQLEVLQADYKRKSILLSTTNQECKELRRECERLQGRLDEAHSGDSQEAAELHTANFAYRTRCRHLAKERTQFAAATRGLLATCASLLILADPNGDCDEGEE